MARSPPLLCELARHEGRRLKCCANATGTPEHSNDASVCPPESSVFERAGESTRQKVAGKLPFRRITKRQHAATGDIFLALAKSHRGATGEQSFTMNHNAAQR